MKRDAEPCELRGHAPQHGRGRGGAAREVRLNLGAQNTMAVFTCQAEHWHWAAGVALAHGAVAVQSLHALGSDLQARSSCSRALWTDTTMELLARVQRVGTALQLKTSSLAFGLLHQLRRGCGREIPSSARVLFGMDIFRGQD